MVLFSLLNICALTVSRKGNSRILFRLKTTQLANIKMDDATSDAVMVRDQIGVNYSPSLSSDASRQIKIISWNVAGLRGILKKNKEILNDLIQQQEPDIICLQEHKLQQDHLKEFSTLLNDKGFKSYWTCSETKKGYAGTVAFIRGVESTSVTNQQMTLSNILNEKSIKPMKSNKKPKLKQSTLSSFSKIDGDTTKSEIESSALIQQEKGSNILTNSNNHDNKIMIQNVKYELPDIRFNGEGRWVEIETPQFYFINCYVPNSGDGLVRLDYRVDEW